MVGKMGDMVSMAWCGIGCFGQGHCLGRSWQGQGLQRGDRGEQWWSKALLITSGFDWIELIRLLPLRCLVICLKEKYF